MYEYLFEQVAFGVFGKPQGDYHEIARVRAAQGWRLAHFAQVPTTEGGGQAIELVFERRVSGPQDATRADDVVPPNYQAPPNF